MVSLETCTYEAPQDSKYRQQTGQDCNQGALLPALRGVFLHSWAQRYTAEGHTIRVHATASSEFRATYIYIYIYIYMYTHTHIHIHTCVYLNDMRHSGESDDDDDDDDDDGDDNIRTTKN